MSVSLADIDGDGDKDIFSGSYSMGSRDKDDVNNLNNAFGSVVWFENKNNSWKKNNILVMVSVQAETANELGKAQIVASLKEK